MLGLAQIQMRINKVIAAENKKYILKRLEEYYEITNKKHSISAKELAIIAFWRAKKRGKLDNLHRIVK